MQPIVYPVEMDHALIYSQNGSSVPNFETHNFFRIFLEIFLFINFVICFVKQLITPNLKNERNSKMKVSRKI